MARSILKRFLYLFLILGVPGFLIVATFQNCAKVSFEAASEDLKSFGDPVSKTPQYAEFKAGDDSFLPPLKMIFVVDNSGSMQANQINLGSAFSKLFEGSNGKNLAPFDTTAYVFNTAQQTVAKNADLKTYERLPKAGIENFAALSMADLAKGPRATLLDGRVPGDLVGYRVLEMSADGLNSTSYLPAPVARFSQERGRTFASLLAHKLKDGSIADFSQEFRERIAVLDPARSMIDSQTKTGVLDSVIDKESGLCSLARVMRHKEDFLKPGELAAFVVVSDENDSDPVGKNCIDSISDQRGNENLVDGKCITQKTTIKYRERNPNPAAANCTIAYDSGFRYKYDYSVLQSELKYYLLQRDYKVRQTEILYSYASSYVYKQPQVTLSYFTKAPTYKLPQTTITYYRKVETCESYREGSKFGCTYEYPKTTTGVIALSFSDCRAFAQGKIPNDALRDDPAYPLSCNKLDPISKVGACSESDPNVIDCQQNYSAARKTSSPMDGTLPTTDAACIAFANGKLEASAVLGDSDHAVKCASAGTRNQSGSGFCPNNGLACDQESTPTRTIVDGVQGSSVCLDFAKAKKSILNANAILDGSASATCTESTGREVKNEVGRCSTLDVNATTACTQHPAATESKATAGVRPAGTTCLQFIEDVLGTNTIIDETANVTCADPVPTSRTSGEKTIAFSDASVTNYNPAVNDDCLAVLKNKIQSNDGQTATKCMVTNLVTADFSYNEGKTCEQLTNPVQKCSASNNALHNCRNPRSTQPGDAYKPSLSEISGIEGTFTCSSLCKDTNLCPTKSGTVSENFKDCEVKAANSERGFSRVPASRAICSGSEVSQPIITQTYPPEIGSRIDYVAGSRSSSNEPDALANYIRDQAGSSVQSVSVFVRQPNDPTGAGGSTGTAYNRFVDIMGGGDKKSVLGRAEDYASALESLGSVISQKLRRSFAIQLQGNQSVKRVWFRKAGSLNWGEPLAETEYNVTGGTVTLSASFAFDYQDEFRFEYY